MHFKVYAVGDCGFEGGYLYGPTGLKSFKSRICKLVIKCGLYNTLYVLALPLQVHFLPWFGGYQNKMVAFV